MVLWNGEKTQVCFLDSCVLTYMLSDSDLFVQIARKKCIYAITQFNLFERMKNTEFYIRTLEMLNELPVVIFKHFDQLLDLEIQFYQQGSAPPVISMISPYGMLLNRETRKMLCQNMISAVFIKEHSFEFDKGKHDILKSIQTLKTNLDANPCLSHATRADKFVFDAMVERLTIRNPTFMGALVQKMQRNESDWKQSHPQKAIPNSITRQIELEILPDLYVFKSWAMPLYIAYYKYYAGTDTPRLSDIGDLAMSSAFPYCDILIIEKNNANKLSTIKRNHSILDSVEILTTKNRNEIVAVSLD